MFGSCDSGGEAASFNARLVSSSDFLLKCPWGRHRTTKCSELIDRISLYCHTTSQLYWYVSSWVQLVQK